MNAGLGNLDSVRKHLLAGTLAGETRFDAVIEDIGNGVASAFERECNRLFDFAVEAQVQFPADHDCFVAPRYPLVSVDKLEIRDYHNIDWLDISQVIFNFDPGSGLVRFGGRTGTSMTQTRLTFTGGYWFETLEPDEGLTDMPAGATPLPDDLRLAWLLQCRAVWDAADKLGTGLVDKPGVQSALGTLELIPGVKRTLSSYRRMQMS